MFLIDEIFSLKTPIARSSNPTILHSRIANPNV